MAYAAIAATTSAQDLARSGAPTGQQTSKRAVHIEKSSCRAAPTTEVLGVLRVELATRLVEWPLPGNAYQIMIDCSDDVVVVSVAVTERETRSYRTNLTNVPANVRPRIVALAIAEIVRDLDRESTQLAVDKPMPTDAAPPRTDFEPRPTALLAPGERHPAELGVFLQTSSFRFDGTWLAGGGPRFDYTYRWMCAGIDAAFLVVDDRFSAGSVQVLLSYGSPYVAWRGVSGRWQTRVGAGYALGAARVAGHAADPHFAATLTGAWAAPYAFAALALALTESIRIDLRAQAGWVTLPVVGQVSVQGGTDVNLDGLWTSVQIGAGLAL